MLISANELLQAQRDDKDLLLLDCRHDLMNPLAGEEAYVSGHIPGAYLIHMDEQLSGQKNGHNGRHPLPPAEHFRALLDTAGLRPNTTLVAYDNNGGQFAARAWWLARWIGHEAVCVLDGGLNAWKIAGGNLEVGLSPGRVRNPTRTPMQAQMSNHMQTVDAAFLLANINLGGVVVVDARAAPRYRGEVEPIDPVAGHIPNALNRPTSLNLAENGCFKSAELLRAEYQKMLAGCSPRDIVHQCGSGVTACHNLLAMEIAGLTGSKLYPGSWSEWVSDPSRPISTQHS
jgi:thiosulfate/3-mercaptopyruvate sulfurtransferase